VKPTNCTWRSFKERCARDGLGKSEEVLSRQLRLHLPRGISYLATPHLVRSIADLVRLAGEATLG
jgi:DNA sulfur modification protein DndE